LTIRQFYNTLGDVIKSHFGRDIWAKMTLENINYIDEMVGLDVAIVTDLRYPIEQEALKEFSEANNIELVVIKMVNLNYPQRTDNLNPKEHESEFLVDDIKEDHLIESRTVDETKEKIKEIYNATTNPTNTD
jgi:signal recognition particle subunit SEC65